MEASIYRPNWTPTPSRSISGSKASGSQGSGDGKVQPISPGSAPPSSSQSSGSQSQPPTQPQDRSVPGGPAQSEGGNKTEQAGRQRQDSEGRVSRETRLDAEERQRLRELQQRDRKVRAHEAAHLSAGGQFARGGANYTYERGPDGQYYAVGGEVSLDASRVPDDPQATLEKARALQRAALAPAEPSSQDLQVAAQARAMAAEARAEIREDGQGRDPGRAQGDEAYRKWTEGRFESAPSGTQVDRRV